LIIKDFSVINICSNLQALEGTDEWYWCSTLTDIYEAEEAMQAGKVLEGTKLFLIHYPDGRVYQPFPKREKTYMNVPVWDNDRICISSVDFNTKEISVYCFYPSNEEVKLMATLPLSVVPDCYNLRLFTEPLMLTRNRHENKFHIIWPEKISIDVGNTESLICRDNDKLYFSAWFENPDYNEKIIVRDIHTGSVLEEYPGTLYRMPNGEWWKTN